MNQRNFLQGNFHTEVATGDHDAVEGQDDGFQRIHGFRLLQLGDHGNATLLFIHNLVHQFHVRRGANEGQRHHVHAEFQREAEVFNVFFTEGWDGDIHPRQGHTLVVGDGAAFHNLADHIVAVYFNADEADFAIVHEQAVAGLGVFGQPFVGGGHAVMGAGDVVNGDANNLTIVPVGFPIDEAPQADLWPLQVCKDAYGATGLVGCFTNPFVVLLMIFMVAMREVHPGDVHAGFHKTEDSLFACDGWTQRTHNFCSSIHASHPNHLWPHKPHRNAR